MKQKKQKHDTRYKKKQKHRKEAEEESYKKY